MNGEMRGDLLVTYNFRKILTPPLQTVDCMTHGKQTTSLAAPLCHFPSLLFNPVKYSLCYKAGVMQ